MRTTIKEGVLVWPLVAAAAFCLVYGLMHTQVWAMLGLVDLSLVFPKIERFRTMGLDIVAACDLAAEQHNLDTEDLAAEHFAWKLQYQGMESRPK